MELGLEEFLGKALDRIGLDLRRMSRRPALLLAALYYVGSVFLAGGSYYFLNHRDNGVHV
jgi:hypothetical protein